MDQGSQGGISVSGYLPGRVYLTPDGNSGIFLTPENSAALVSIIEQVEGEPTIAGPEVDLTPLSELRHLLGMSSASVREDEPPTVLSQELAVYLELIVLHADVKGSLSPKLRFKCHNCQEEFTRDPEHLARRQAEAKAREHNATLNDMFRIDSQAHAHHRFGTALAVGMAMTRPRYSAEVVCPNCGHNRLDVWDVTNCPHCGKPRREMMLLRCPDCKYDYRERSGGPIWLPSSQAIDAFRVHWKQTAIINTVSSLWVTTMPRQIGDLIADLSPDEQLIGICKYSWMNGQKRNVIVLFTSEKVVWTVRRKALWSDRSWRAWDQIQEISSSTDGQGELYVVQSNGVAVRFSGLTGPGADMSVENRPFGPLQIRQATRRMLAER
jgi:rubrerythrin